MLKYFGAAAFAAAIVAPAHAATIIIVSPDNTAVTGSTAMVFRDFTTANPSGTTLQTITNGAFADGTPDGGTFSETRVIGATQQGTGFVETRDTMLAGMDGDYLALGRLSSYTISFASNPVSYFSFAFNGIDQNSTVRLNYVGGTTQFFDGRNDILTGINTTFGRVSYHTGTGPQIASVVFARKNTGQAAFTVDSFAAAAPEPATWLMMILGFGLAGTQLRRRRDSKAIAAA